MAQALLPTQSVWSSMDAMGNKITKKILTINLEALNKKVSGLTCLKSSEEKAYPKINSKWVTPGRAYSLGLDMGLVGHRV